MMRGHLAAERVARAVQIFVALLKIPLRYAGFLQCKRLRHDFGVDTRSGM